MSEETNRREFVQVAGLAASGLVAAAAPMTGAAQAQPRLAPKTMGARFRELMSGPEPLICANAYDLLTARMIEVHGFKSVFVGSSATNLEFSRCRTRRSSRCPKSSTMTVSSPRT